MNTLNSEAAVKKFLEKHGRGQLWFRNAGKYNRELRNSVTGESRSTGQLKQFTEEEATKLVNELLLTQEQLADAKKSLREELDGLKQRLAEKLEDDDFSRVFDGDDFSELASQAQNAASRLKAALSL